ncbi:MAG: MerR family transcriptional regulator [Spirochaetales bacterium]
MERFSIGQVCAALDVKAHVVRYWEQEIGILSPSKDLNGRRTYNRSDVQLLARIKHLVQEKRYTVKGAAEQILLERSDSHADTRASIHEVRGELLDMLGKIRGGSSHDSSENQGSE